MKTMKWLLQREFWEHKGSFLWAPLAVAAAMVLLIGGGFLYSMAAGQPGDFQVDGRSVVIDGIPHGLRDKIAHVAASGYLGASAPLFVVLGVVAFFYCLSALYDDRRDRSILFWKSLPLSDRDMVLSKVATAVIVAPLVTIAVGLACSLVMLLVGMFGASTKGLNLFVPVLSNANFYLSPLYLLAFLPLYILWALPTVGYLLLVSAWARSKVFLWAVGIPVVTLVLLKWFNMLVGQMAGTEIDVDWFAEEVVVRGLLGLFPGLWMGQVDGSRLTSMQNDFDPAVLLGVSYSSLSDPGVWLGVLAGAAMIYAAMRLRRWRDEG